jgi:hypothetical protein
MLVEGEVRIELGLCLSYRRGCSGPSLYTKSLAQLVERPALTLLPRAELPHGHILARMLSLSNPSDLLDGLQPEVY